MIRALGAVQRAAHGKIEIMQFLNLNVARQLGKRHWKISTLHLTGQCIHQPFSSAFTAKNPQPATRFINGGEKWQSLDVVPMRMRQQQGKIKRLLLELL